jgi:ion channel-forming bestrophin family protein
MIMDWMKLTRSFVSTRIFRRIAVSVMLCSLYSVFIECFQLYVLKQDVKFTSGMHILIAFIITVALAYKTNSSYDRWWEGRKQWGGHLAGTRCLAALVCTFKKVPAEDRRLSLRYLLEFSTALKDHVRGEWPKPRNFPLEIHQKQLSAIASWRDNGWIGDNCFYAAEQHLSASIQTLGAFERLRGTLLPPTHRVIGPQLVILYILVMPWGMDSHISNVFLVGGVSYSLLSLLAVAEDIEEPFGTETDDLDIESLCNGIHRFIDAKVALLAEPSCEISKTSLSVD